MKVSVVTPWHNHPELIPDYEAAVRLADEVVIVDNASRIECAVKLMAMCERLGGRYIRNETNRWFSAATNQGIKASTGDIVVALNNDIAGDPKWINQVRGDIGNDLVGPRLVEKPIAGILHRYIEGWCCAARRETWNALGGFDESAYPMPLYEDNDLSLRATIAGIGLTQRPWPVSHKVGATRASVKRCHDGEWENAGTFVRRLWKSGARPSKENLIAVVQLGRIGDILTALPIMKSYADRGYKVYHIVHPDFVGVVDGLSYVKPIGWQCRLDDSGAAGMAIEYARSIGFERVIATQDYGNPRGRNPKARNWAASIFHHAGMYDQFNELPLLLDNRDRVAESLLVLRHTDTRPAILINTSGITSPYPFGNELRSFLSKYAESHRIIDLGLIRCRRIQDLLGLYERSRLLISTDTSTLHLGYATKTPTIAILQDDEPSEQRHHWKLSVLYRNSVGPKALREMSKLIESL